MTSSTQGRSAVLVAALVLLAALAATGLAVRTARAEDAIEANTFGVDGVASQSLGTNFAQTSFESALARPDGGLFVRQDQRIDVLFADGAPDPAFAPIPAKTQGSGLFPVAGGEAFVVDERKVTRLNPDGTVDTSFGQGGSTEPQFPVRAVGELGSGKVVLAGINQINAKDPGRYVGVLVLNQDGSPVGPEVRSSPADETEYGKGIYEIVPAPGGGALIVGSKTLFRLSADGSTDRSFGRNGAVSGEGGFLGARFLADGSVEVIADRYLEKKKRSVPAIFRYTASGNPVASFGHDGVELLDLPEWEHVTSVLWSADGSALIGGEAESHGPSCAGRGCEDEPAVAALDPDGDLAPGFGEGGQIRFPALADPAGHGGVATGRITALVRRPDGSIVAVGSTGPNGTAAFAAAFSLQGAPLPSFGEGGIVRAFEPVPARQEVAGLASLPSGQILAAGAGDVGVATYPILARYTADGNLDPAFGGGTGFVGLGGNAHKATGLAVRGERALVGISPFRGSSGGGRLLLLGTADGSPVASFGNGGKVDLAGRDSARALTFASDGDPVVLDSVLPEGEIDEPVLFQRFEPDGDPDRAFGRGGRALLELPGGGLRVDTVIAGPGGRVFVGGSARHRFVIASLLPDGSLDPRFGSGGWASMTIGRETGPVDLVRDGRRLYLAGTARGRHSRLVLARFDLHGHLDHGLGGDGTLTAPASSEAEPTAIVPTRTGAVVVVDHGSRPVSVFAGDHVTQQRPPGAEAPVGDARATVSLGRLILGWTPRSVGFILSPEYRLSASPLEP